MWNEWYFFKSLLDAGLSADNKLPIDRRLVKFIEFVTKQDMPRNCFFTSWVLSPWPVSMFGPRTCALWNKQSVYQKKILLAIRLAYRSRCTIYLSLARHPVCCSVYLAIQSRVCAFSLYLISTGFEKPTPAFFSDATIALVGVWALTETVSTKLLAISVFAMRFR